MSFGEKLSKQIDLIKSILSDPKLQSSKNIESKVYSDQPIIIKASHMAGFMPDEYKKMKAIATDPQNLGRPDSWIFVEQGRLMVEFEDDYYFNRDVVRYFPTYKSLNDEELRGYFSWRTKIRAGYFEKAPLSFAYIYFYELLNMIGCCSPTDAFEKMLGFVNKYSKIDDGIAKYANTWMFDFAVFHGLDKRDLYRIYDFTAENAIEKLLRYEQLESDELFDALVVLSSYGATASKLYKQYPAEVRTVAANVYKAYALYCDKKCEKSLHIRLFGLLFESTYSLLYNAVFYGRNKHADCEYTVSEIHKYTCKDGVWKSCRYIGATKQHSNKHIGMMLKAVDRILREKLGVSPSLVQGKEPKILISIIVKECEKLLLSKKEAEKRRVEIDISKLDSIRISSESVMEKLIVDDDLIEDVEEVTEEIAEQNNTVELPLGADEYNFLLGIVYKKANTEKSFMTSVIADAINEKLFDTFGDNVIEFDGDEPFVVEDYKSELCALLKGEQK